MKKFILALVLASSFVFMFNGYARMALQCRSIPPTPENAGRILDWCDDVTCRECRDYSAGDPIIHFKECWANC